MPMSQLYSRLPPWVSLYWNSEKNGAYWWYMSVRRKLSSPKGKIPLWANTIIITITGTKNAASRPSDGFKI